MVIDLDAYRVLKKAGLSALKNAAHEKGIVSRRTHPAAIYRFGPQKTGAVSPELPEDLSEVDVAAFLGRIYTLASQI